MRPEEWSRVKELFATALLLAADVRQAHIDQVCSGDEALRDQVKQLLASHEHAHSFLERPPRLPANETLSSILEGRRIGPYELSMRIGAGGMDEVYKARDTRLDRTVAIKVLPPHIADDPVAR